MRNTRINYLYTDASNYKAHNTAVVSGELSEAQIAEINACLHDSEFFIPAQVGLPEERFEKWDDQDDHCWFTLQSIYSTPEAPTVSLTAEQLLSNFRASKNNWRDNERYEELSASMDHYEQEEEEDLTEQEAPRGKIVKIDGQMYELRVPTSGDNIGLDAEWEEIVLALYPAKHNPLHLGEGIFSLCQDAENRDDGYVMGRGGTSAKAFGPFTKNRHAYNAGYRPILIPLDEHTLQPDTDYMSAWKDGTLFEMGTLYMDNEAVKLPDNPTLYGGNTQAYQKDAWLDLRDSGADPATHIRWIKAGNFLVADRNLLVNISWNDLDKQGLVPSKDGPEPKRSLDDIIKGALDWSFKHMDFPEPNKEKLDELFNEYKKTLDEKTKKALDDFGR